MMVIPETPSGALAVGLPAQFVRRFAERLLSDPAEVDDLVEEILGACVAEFPEYDPRVSGEDWVMRVAARVVEERWRRSARHLAAVG
jgi:DNA-directed RNA polymerase specialized sigma24 family protein